MCSPTAIQKRFHDALAKSGCVITGNPIVQLHHLEGRCFKHKKQLIGQWLVIPLCLELHEVHSNHSLNVTHHKNLFHETYGTGYELLIKAIERLNTDCIPSDDVLLLAQDYYKVNDDITDWLSVL